MASQDSFGAKGTLDVDGQSYEIYRLDAVKGEGLDVESLPFSLKVLLENLLRTEDGADITADDIRALAVWDENADRFTNTVTVTVGRLRRKLGAPPVITTTPGVGYRIG